MQLVEQIKNTNLTTKRDRIMVSQNSQITVFLSLMPFLSYCCSKVLQYVFIGV